MSIDNWDDYWRTANSEAAHRDGGPQDEVLETFWLGLFRELFPGLAGAAVLLDVACGNGAVPRFAHRCRDRLDEQVDLAICGIDESLAALGDMKKREPSVFGIVSAARSLPFKDQSLSFITSQFGMEYAGLEVVSELSRVLKPGGIIAAVLHMHDGGIYRECEINFRAIESFRNTGILGNFETLYNEVVLNRDNKDAEKVRRLDRTFAGSVRDVEAILGQWGKGVASDTLFRIYTDIGHMYQRMDSYEPQELLNWVAVMNNDLSSYSGRMASMLASALGDTDFQDLLRRLEGLGLDLRHHDTLMFGARQVPSAWMLVAQKTA